MKKEVKNDTFKSFVVEGIVVGARRGRTRYSEDIKNRVDLKSDSIPYEEIHAFENSGAKLTPSWFKDKTGYINSASQYDIPVKDTRGKVIDFETWINDYNALGSKVKMSFTQKDTAIYPKAIKVIEDGEARDPFEDL